ncbi:MAG TPA: double-strand break repair protein AddB, partial [Beijerinckiaceae bacterium]|nr:double-strand break repair protein AddB [Beijerinckiaceae bacterium]
ARCRMLSEALRPADTTDGWAEMDAEIRADLSRRGCAGIKLVDAADEREEALAAAIALRETLVAPGRTAALVTPDRALAKRVAAELARWGIAVEDSAGVPLSETPAGVAARLAADAAALDFHPIRVLALLAHPLVCLGRPRAVIERAASALEIGILRGPAPAPGADGLRQAFARGRNVLAWHAPRAKKRLTDEDWRLAADLVEWLAAAFDGFTPEAFGEHETDLVMIAEAHRRMLDVLLDDPNEESSEVDDDSRQHLAALFDDLALTKARHVEGTFSDYPSFFTALARERVASSPARATHRRIKILGLLEARLLAVDRVVLGGLDEGVWPPRAETDAFLNRPMRSRVGLSPPERRIGQTAHDFVQALGMKDVVITRARKRGGSPMVPSRFLQRIKAFADDGIWGGMVEAGRRYLDLARVLDTPKPVPPLLRPAPKPDAGLFPRSLSVTEIETLVRDPYAIFARHILKLDPLDPLAALPGAAERGTVIHDILKDFAAAHPREMPPDASADLMERGLNAFARIADAFPDLYAQWWPRFERLVPAFLKWEEERRRDAAVIHPERSGSLPLPLPDGSVFTLRARADRIEQRPGGGFAIVDFKTGAPPSNKVVAIGFSPQMTLEAAMLMRGAFKDLPAAQETPELVYVRVAGGQKPLEPRPVEQPRDDPRAIATIVEDHLAGLTALVARYMGGDASFLSRPYAQYARRFSDYDHLARVKEWSVTSGTASEGGAE